MEKVNGKTKIKLVEMREERDRQFEQNGENMSARKWNRRERESD